MAQKLAAATSALSTTVNRLTGAINRHSDSGEVTQTNRAQTLIAHLAADKAALKSAGHRQAAALGIQGTVVHRCV